MQYRNEITHQYFYKPANHEVTVLIYSNRENFIKESEGSNYSRIIIIDPDHNRTSVVSRIDNTLVVAKDVPNASLYKIRDSLGSIGY